MTIRLIGASTYAVLVAMLAITTFIVCIALFSIQQPVAAHSPMPCHWEDEVLVGTGDFIQGYGWEGMTCIPADDLNPTGPNWAP